MRADCINPSSLLSIGSEFYGFFTFYKHTFLCCKQVMYSYVIHIGLMRNQ